MSYEDYEPDWSEGPDMDDTKASGEGIVVQINNSAMERIESAAMVGVRQEIAKRLDKVIQDEIAGIVEDKLREVVGGVAEKAVLEYLTKPRQKTNAWGEAVGGGTVTLSELIPQKVESWLTESVKSDGSRVTDSYDRKHGQPRMEWMMNKYVRDELSAATKTAAAEVTEQAKKVVAAHVGRFVAEQMIPQIEVNGSAAR